MSNSASGFGYAPVSKFILIGTAAGSILTQSPRTFSATWARPLVWRAPGDFLFGSFLLYYFRLLERNTGSRSHASFVLLTTGLSLALTHGISKLLHIAPAVGPYGLVFAMFAPFFATVPPSSRFSVFGWRLSDKSFIYMAGLQLMLSGGLPTMVAGLSGVTAGLLYRVNFLGIRRFRVPRPICRLVGRLLGPLLDSGGPQVIGQGGPQQGGQQRPRPGAAGAGRPGAARGAPGVPAAPAPAALVQPSEEAVEQLLAMGFERAAVVRALQASNNDVQAAIALLL